MFEHLSNHGLYYLALLTVVVDVAVCLEIVLGNRTIQFLRDVAPWKEITGREPCGKETNGGWITPKASVIVAVRNEERNLEAAMRSVLAQEYEQFEVLAVNDRSSDGSGVILDRMARDEPRLRVIHVTELPKGWLGKNHALHTGARHATGNLLLFTDADVIMERSALGRAVRYLMEHNVDHLAILPKVAMPGVLLNWLCGAFGILFVSFTKPWKAADAGSRKHIGVGAFNLLRREVYQAIGAHRAIAMRPDDDLKLGKLVKLRGYRQRVLFGAGLLEVEWYASFGEMVDGLMKNAFAGLDYRLSVVLGATLGVLVFNVWPFAALFVTSGATLLINAALLLLFALLAWDSARFYGMKRWNGIGFPIAAAVFLYILWRSTLITLVTRGITWRGTRYPLDELKANKV